MRQKVFILGATGNVGTELLKQISADDGIHQNINPTQVIGFASSKKMALSYEGFSEETLATISQSKETIQGVLESQGKEYSSLCDILKMLKKVGHAGDVIIVDATGAKGAEIRRFHLDAVSPKYDFSIVTANKNVVSLEDQATFDRVTKSHGRYDYNTAVMAGAGAVDFLVRARDTHDKVESIEGCFSGTLGYIAAELEKGEKTFSQIVREALGKGYTEPHPWDDLSGLDVARKLVILARTAGYGVDMKDIEIEGFVDNKYGEITDVDAFLKALKAEDESMARRYQQAKARGNTLKYVASFKIEINPESPKTPQIKLQVKLTEVPLDSAIGSLKGTNNIARIETKIYSGTRAWTLTAPGAGLDTTALSLRASIASMLPQGLPRV